MGNEEAIIKCGLGTAQFGLNYGITNNSGMTSAEDVTAILTRASGDGLGLLDTAQAYGSSETIIGQFLGSHTGHFNIITKLSFVQTAAITSNSVVESLKGSLERLHQKKVYGALIHDSSLLIGPNGDHIWQGLELCKKEDLIEKIGVSVYAPEELEIILEKYDVDLLQLPFNILDDKFPRSVVFKRLKDKGVEIHGRSIFLQGLLLVRTDDLPPDFTCMSNVLNRLDETAQKHNISRQALLLKLTSQITKIDRFIIGVNSFKEYETLLNSLEQANACPDIQFSVGEKFSDKLLDPRLWP